MSKIPWTVLSILALVVAACAVQPAATGQPGVASSTVALSPTPLPPTPEPTAVPTLAISSLLAGAEAPLSVASFADIPNNVATSETAPDFSARIMDGTAFNLATQRGSPVLLLPTVSGCGDCIRALEAIAEAYADYRGRELKVVALDLFPEDSPDVWREFASYIGEPEFLWGVVDSADFAVDYHITTLGTTLLVDPVGKVVFRINHPAPADTYRQVFDLAMP